MITYKGIERYENEWLATYFLGHFNYNQLEILRQDFLELSLYETRTPVIHHSLTERFIKKNHPVLGEWLKESKAPFGGYIDEKTGKVYILFIPKSIEEMTFRLTFGVKVENP